MNIKLKDADIFVLLACIIPWCLFLLGLVLFMLGDEGAINMACGAGVAALVATALTILYFEDR